MNETLGIALAVIGGIGAIAFMIWDLTPKKKTPEQLAKMTPQERAFEENPIGAFIAFKDGMEEEQHKRRLLKIQRENKLKSAQSGSTSGTSSAEERLKDMIDKNKRQ